MICIFINFLTTNNIKNNNVLIIILRKNKLIKIKIVSRHEPCIKFTNFNTIVKHAGKIKQVPRNIIRKNSFNKNL